jgi:thiosulfate/3-mercaptopyruvate sulfurtransferase
MSRRFLIAAAAAALSLLAAPLAQAAEPIVSAEWLRGKLSSPDIIVVDIRAVEPGGKTNAYEDAHIPGAQHADYFQAGWRAKRDGVPGLLPNKTAIENLAGSLGIDETKHVVITWGGLDNNEFGAAARVYWTFKVYGHDNVSILDGGQAAWVAAGYLTQKGKSPQVAPALFEATLRPELHATLARMKELVGTDEAILLDARPPEFYAGKQKHDAAAAYGHLPGAQSLTHDVAFVPGSTKLKSREELAKAFGSVGEGPVVSYCNTGHWAATNWFVLSEMLGRKNVALYDGSMVEWSKDASRPIVSSRTRLDDLKRFLRLGS